MRPRHIDPDIPSTRIISAPSATSDPPADRTHGTQIRGAVSARANHVVGQRSDANHRRAVRAEPVPQWIRCALSYAFGAKRTMADAAL